MKTLTVTVGWTKSRVEKRDGRDVLVYSSFSGYEKGAEQHTETIGLDMSEDVTDEAVCELIFRATNDPYAEDEEIRPDLARVAALLHVNGYRGQGAHWSLSVGDTVTVDGTMYACESSGWRLVPMTAFCTTVHVDDAGDDADCNCEWPEVGTRVRTIVAFETREPGDDEETPIPVAKDALGTVSGYVREWYDLDVLLDTGERVWISPDRMELADPPPNPLDKPALVTWLEQEIP